MKKHEIDVFSLLFGLAFLVIAASWVAVKTIELSLTSFGWLLAGALVLIGLVGVFTAIRPSRTR